MTQVYLPWPQRPPREWRGVSAAVARAAQSVYRRTRPILQRFAGAIFLAATAGVCLLAWSAGLLLSAAVRVQDTLILRGDLPRGGWATLAQVRAAARELGYWTPAWLLWPFQSLLLRDAVGLAGVVAFVSVLAMFAIWWERKVSARIQSRLGPMRVGGWHGWSQSLADGIKLLCKEDLIPAQADRPLFRLAPYLTFVPAILAFVALPFGVSWVFRDLDIALLFVIAMLGLEVVGVLLAGWASNNKWSMYGAIREAAQVVSYEIPMLMALLVPIMTVGSLRFQDIAAHQTGGWFHWLAWHSPWTFVAMFIFFIAALASCKRAPFDLPEAESELVAGFHTEYSGFRWSLFFFAEYAAMFVVSGLVVILFLGAWDAPWAGLAPSGWPASESLGIQLIHGVLFSGPLWFIAKCLFLVYVQMWLRWTLPRPRVDQVLYACVQVLLPLTFVVLLAAAAWELGLAQSVGFATVNSALSVILSLIGAVTAVGIIWIGMGGLRRRQVLVGSMANERVLPGG